MSDQSNRDFLEAATLVLHSVESVAADLNDIKRFQSDGELYGNNWENGDADYRARIKDVAGRVARKGENRWAGRSDIFEWIDRDLAPLIRAVNADFAKRYGWNTAGSADIRRSSTKDQGVGPGHPIQDDAAATRGAVRQADVDPALKDGRGFTGFFSNISTGFTGRPGSEPYAPWQAM